VRVVRIIASTNKDLLRSVREDSFRDNLYFRLNVTRSMPRLRERAEIGAGRPLPGGSNKRLGRSIKRASSDAMAALMSYDWPGNIRELKNAIERAAVVTDGDVLTLAGLPPPIRPAGVGLVAGVASAQWDGPGTLSLDEKMAHSSARSSSRRSLAPAASGPGRGCGITERSVWHLVRSTASWTNQAGPRAWILMES
jgi:DNA-binding NtrC family response regulator